MPTITQVVSIRQRLDSTTSFHQLMGGFIERFFQQARSSQLFSSLCAASFPIMSLDTKSGRSSFVYLLHHYFALRLDFEILETSISPTVTSYPEKIYQLIGSHEHIRFHLFIFITSSSTPTSRCPSFVKKDLHQPP
jgi:hypothetical protein